MNVLVGPTIVAPLDVWGLPFLFGAVAWAVARERGVPGGWPAFLWGFVLGPIGLGVVAVFFRGGQAA